MRADRRAQPFLRLVCVCGRNLADVTYSEGNADWTSDKLLVTPRPNVEQDDFRLWPVDPNADPHARTYTWTCKCGRHPAVKHGRISTVWEEFRYSDTPLPHRVIVNA